VALAFEIFNGTFRKVDVVGCPDTYHLNSSIRPGNRQIPVRLGAVYAPGKRTAALWASAECIRYGLQGSRKSGNSVLICFD